jgi:hypothetical protein
MCRCKLCFSFTGHEADYAVSFGSQNKVLKVCRFCQKDLALLGFRANQVVRLEASKPSGQIPLALLVLGPVYTLLEASGA